jgi:ribosomal-protein-alanine N-acetyltransferase
MFRDLYKTYRLSLKKINNALIEEHFDDICSLYKNYEVMKYSGFGNLQSDAEVRELFYKYLNKENFFLWLLIKNDDNRYIGDISLNADLSHYYCSVGCFLLPEFWYQGFMTEAMRELLFSAFNEFGFHRIEAQIHENNINSIKFFEKFGFKFEGIVRENFYINGSFYNSRLYSMLFDEFFEKYISI